MDKPPNTYWNGLPTRAIRGTAIVADALQVPLYWARVEGILRTRISVVRVSLDGVNMGGGVMYLDDRDNEGWFKVTEGFGSPRYSHKTVHIVPRSFERA